MRQIAGYSLVETLIALGLVGGVLISISGTFLAGGRSIRSGRRHTAALAVARDVLESLEARPYRQVYGGFGLSGTAAAYRIDSRSNPFAAAWQPSLEAVLESPRASIEIESVDSGLALIAADAMRIAVTVSWREGPRARAVRLATVRI